ncbi:MAG: acyl-CoA/acyl-ACP dehydrogenase, partial [Nocardiopsaceae bacterium]|nr:acyl-CoA/acyl-ACP dehydrogenase [Nocardiopsaceae bacterium]
MPIAATAEQAAIADSLAQWAKRAGTIAAVRGLESSGGRASSADHPDLPVAGELWSGLAELGIFSIPVPEADGGGGGTVADVAVVAEQLATVMAPGPILPTLLGGLILARSSHVGGADYRTLLADTAAGKAAIGIGLTPDGVTGSMTTAGEMRVRGTARLVLGGGDVTWLLLGGETSDGPRWFLVRPGEAGVSMTARSPVDFSRPLADVSLQDVLVPPGRLLPAANQRLVPDLAATLAAAEASGVAAWCIQAAVEYARTRHQFGRPIGSFQAIKHRCA